MKKYTLVKCLLLVTVLTTTLSTVYGQSFDVGVTESDSSMFGKSHSDSLKFKELILIEIIGNQLRVADSLSSEKIWFDMNGNRLSNTDSILKEPTLIYVVKQPFLFTDSTFKEPVFVNVSRNPLPVVDTSFNEPIILVDDIEDFIFAADSTAIRSDNQNVENVEESNINDNNIYPIEYSQYDSIQTNFRGGQINGFDYPQPPNTNSSEPEAVGATPGFFDVSATGAAIYSIPIKCPPGVGGLQPQIAITYNSQAGNGIAGYGTSISGISAITRGPKNIYYDSIAKPITFNMTDDAYYLDGKRLIFSSGTPGYTNIIYCPENDPFTKVTLNPNGSSSWFEIIDKDGVKYRYGSGSNSRLSPPQSNPYAWFLDEVEDPLGNYMSFTYSVNDYYLYLIQITYGKNKNTTNTLENKIILNYTTTTRIDVVPAIIRGNYGKMNWLLSSITTWTGSYKYREYVLSYSQYDKISRLQTVTEKNGSNESLKPTTFTWDFLPSFSQSQTATSVQNALVYPSVPHSVQTFSSADLNGDGIADLVGVFPIKIPTGPGSYDVTNYVNIYWGSLNSNGNPQFTTGPAYNIGVTFSKKGWIEENGGCFSTDFYGDGINDLIVPHLSVSQSWRKLNFMFIGGVLNIVCQLSSSSDEMPVYASGDMDNDGKSDIIFIEKGRISNLFRCVIIGHVKNTTFKTGTFDFSLPFSNPMFPNRPEKMFIADFNGDGLNDILVLYRNGYTIFWNQGGDISNTTFSDNNKTTGTNISFLGNKIMIAPGDFNGDGLPDFIMNSESSNQWYFALNNGNGTFTKQLACTLDIYYQDFTDKDKDAFNVIVYDFDKDGKSDVVIHKAMYTRKTNIWGQEWGEFDSTYTYWMRSLGTSLKKMASATSNKGDDAVNRFLVYDDFNGDGQIEILHFGFNNIYNSSTSTTQAWRLYRNPDYYVARGKIEQIKSGYGITTYISYDTFTDGEIYTKGTGAVYPLMDCRPPLHAVKLVSYANSATGTTTESYKYAGLKIHLQGKGFLGINSMTVTNTALGTVTESGVEAWNTSWFVPSKTYTSVKIDSKTAKTTVNYTFFDKGSNKVFIYPNVKTEKDMDNNTNTTTYQFNTTYGYITEEKTEFGSSSMYKSTQFSNYILTGGTYKPQLITNTQKHLDDASVFTQKTLLEYYPNSVLIKKKIENYTASLPLTTEFTYDAYGNPTSAKVSGSEVKTITSHTTYDQTGRFPVTLYTAPVSTKTVFQYDIWGNVKKERDETNTANIPETLHDYDNWGRRTLTTLPDGRQIEYLTGWYSGNTAKRFFTIVQGNGIPWVKTWYDAAGIETETETIGAKDISIKTTYTYYTSGNQQGRLLKTENKKGNITLTDNFTYDTRGRITTQSRTGGQSVTYSYGNRSQTASTNGQTYNKTFDAWGNILSSTTSTDQATSVSYNYHSSGQPKKITADGTIFEMTYYDTGSQKTLKDPNAGTTTWTYDAAGRIKTQTDARGYITTIHRDRLERDSLIVMQENSTFTNTSYTYGTSGNNKHRLINVATGGYSIAYDYDSFGRPVTETRSIPSENPLIFSYSYNNNGKLETTSYPGGLQVTTQYDNYGNMVKAIAGSQTVWELTGYTESLTTSVLGGSMTATETYNAQGQLTNLKTVKGATNIRNMDFSFDAATGNLSSRTGMISQTENFTYDKLDRLKTVKHGNSSAMSINYQANGNITNKTGLGAYEYDSNRKHAVVSIDNTAGLLSENEQNITYNAFKKAKQITESYNGQTHKLDIIYGPDQQRWKTELRKSNTLSKTSIYAGNYEKIIEGSITRQLYYLPGGVIYVKETNQSDKIYYAHTDHLGSIMKLTDGNGTSVFAATYDAWGKQTITTNTFKFHRGYTGHEHLPEFSLINMNGRMYDPIVGRFLSPDPFVQAPDFSQSYNRFAYCLNNPLIYTDPSGEFFGSIFTFFTQLVKTVYKTVETALFHGGLDPISSGARKDAWDKIGDHWSDFDPSKPGTKTNNALRIDVGLLMHIPVWETPQTFIGNLVSHFRNQIGHVDEVTLDWKNMTVLVNRDKPGNGFGFTFGPYVNSRDLKVVDETYMHEVGHRKQSAILGPLYIRKVAIPSVLSYWLGSDEYHNNCWYEVWANKLGNVPESDWNPKKYRYHKNWGHGLWYWPLVIFFPIFPH